MQIDINERWTLICNGDNIDLYDRQNQTIKNSITFDLTPKRYNVFIRDNGSIAVKNSERRVGLPKLPKYVEKAIIDLAKELYGDKEYVLLNNR
jgi:hypothetical protein